LFYTGAVVALQPSNKLIWKCSVPGFGAKLIEPLARGLILGIEFERFLKFVAGSNRIAPS
jgi:hypothetical protein